MRKRVLSITVLAVVSTLLLSCGKLNGAEISTTEAGNTLIVTEEFSAVIFTKEFMATYDSSESPSVFWTPKVDQILFMESNLADYLIQNGSGFNSGHAPDEEKLSTYGRQYLGIMVEDKPKILGLFFCNANRNTYKWADQLINVKGGGDCYFGVWYDPMKHEFMYAEANSLE